MRQIKTLIRRIEQAAQFDAEINQLLAEGWTLKKQEVLKLPGEPSEAFNVPGVPALYAELTREVPPFPEEITS
jgi:hypothetical protein